MWRTTTWLYCLQGPTGNTFYKSLRNSLIREVISILEDLRSNYFLEASMSVKSDTMELNMLVSIRIRLQNSRSKVDVIIISYTKVTRYLGHRVLWQCLIGYDILGGKRNGQQLVHTPTYVIRKKIKAQWAKSYFQLLENKFSSDTLWNKKYWLFFSYVSIHEQVTAIAS